MKKLLSFTKKKKNCGTSDNVSALSDGYDLKDKDLGKIHKAVSQGDLTKLKPLAKKNDINQLDKENRTALHIACATGHDEVVQFLVDSKAKLNLRDNQNRSALMKAVEGQHERCVAILLENHADPNLADANGNTALHLAANIPSIPTATRLLQHGAEINSQNKEGFAPLTVAIREDRIEMAEFLLKESADVNSLDHEQRSPLMLAASSGQHSMVKLLLQFDPDITLKDKRGWTADDCAQKNDHHSCSLLITEYGTKRTHRASVSYPGSYKKKKPPSIPFHDPEPGFSLGGPATDKELGTNEAGGDLEDNSLSESVSRASKSANDEWPSTEDDDSSAGKKPLNVNIRRFLVSKNGEGDNSAERGKGKHSEQNLSANNSQEEGSDGEDSGEEVEEEDEEEEEDEDDEEEEGEEDDSEQSDEDGSEEEESHSQNCSATDIRADTQNSPQSKSSLNAETPVTVRHEVDKAETENADVNNPDSAKTSAMPATLDVAGDCIVSAIRVESKLSDEEESVAKECMRSSYQALHLNQISTEVPIPPEAAQSPGKVKEAESERETENDDKDSLNDGTNGVDKVWNDSDNEEENGAEGIGGSTLITCPGKLLADVEKNVKSDAEDNASSSREPVEEGRRKSSWGSSVEGSDVDIPKESEANIEVLQQENDVQPPDMQLEEKEEQPDTSWDSSTQFVLPERDIDDPGLPSSPQAKSKPIVVTAVESDWDSSEVDNQDDTGAQCEVTSLDLNEADNETKETHKCFLQEEEKDSIEKESNDPSPVVSVALECKDAKGPVRCDDGEPAGSASIKEEKSDSENEEGNSSSWDDDYEEESDESDKEEAEKAKTDNIQTEDDTEKIPYSYIDGNYEAEDEAKVQGETLVIDENQSKDVESSEDSDSRHQKLQYDFVSATVKLLDVGGDSAGLCEKSVDEGEARLTSYAPLETETASVAGTRESYEEDQRGEVVFSNSQIQDDDTNGQHQLSEVSDEALPQTDIDDVDLSSPDRSEKTSLRWHELKSTDEPGIQKQNFTEDEKDNDRKGKDEKDSSNANNKSEDSGDVHDGVPTVPKVEVGKDKKRDFRLELGLKKGEGDESSWDSESNSELSNVPHKEEPRLHSPNKEGAAPVEDSLKENVFYIPSFLRGEGGSRMAEIEPRKNVGMPQGSQGEDGSDSRDNQRELPKEDNLVQKKKESSKALTVLSSHKGNVNIMDELGVGDVDDLEVSYVRGADGSDWDSASSVSKRTPPGLKFPSSGQEEFQKDGNSSGGGQKEDCGLPRTSTPKRSSSFGKSLPSTSPVFAPLPQPRTTKISFQTTSNEDSDGEIEKTRGSRENSPTGDRRQSTHEHGTADQSQATENTQDNSDFEEHQEREKDDAVDGCEFSLNNLGHEGSDTEEKMAGKATGAVAAHRKSRISHDGSEADGSEKPGTSVCLSLVQAGRSHQEYQLDTRQRTPVVQSCSGIKQGPEGKLQLELMVHWARQSGGPQANKEVDQAPSPEVEENTISDISDDEGARSVTTDRQKSKVQSLEDLSVPDDLEELTQSSDTDDPDSQTSGYRNAASFKQKLESFALDPTTTAKIQNIFHEYERSIQKLRSRHGHLSDRVNQLEAERTSLKGLLEEVRDARSLLERNQLEIQTELTNIKFQLKQEQENRQNASMMYDTTKDKLKRVEEQHQFEVQDKLKVELSLRNMELEMRTLASNMKQLEEEQHETQKLLAQERTSRALQENLLNNHLRKQKEMEAEHRKNMSRSNEALSQLTEAGDRERELLRQISSLQEQLTTIKSDFEHSQADSSLKESTLVEENEALKEQLEDIRQDLKHSNETVTQTVFACNNQMSALKTELVKTTSHLEQERQTRETLETEAEATRSRLAAAVKEIELRLASHAETEKALLREKEEHQREKDRLTNEITAQREAVSNLKQKLTKADANTNSMENEVHRVTAQLAEKNLLLDALLKEKDFGMARAKELETALQAEKELSSRSVARQEAAEERLAHAQSETMLLRQHLEEAQNQAAAKERAITEAQQRFSDMLTNLRADCEERVHLVEERNKELASKAAELRDLNLKLEDEKNQRENTVRELQQELADSLKKLSMCEASLEVLTRYRDNLEQEKVRLLKDIERLREKLEETEEKYFEAERHMTSMKVKLGETEKELKTTTYKLQEAVATIVATEITTKQLEEAMQKMEIKNAKLEGTTKQQADKIEALQKSAQEAVVVRAHLEELVSNLQGNKISLEEQLNKELHKQSMLSNTMQDSQVLWEEETKSRSKLGLRLTELEREKGELTNQMELEKKKVKKIAEQKKAVDTRLDQEMKRNMELQKEMHRQRTLLKSAKKKLQGPESGGAKYSSMKSPHRRQSQADTWMDDKVEDLQAELEKETSRRCQLEQINGELQDQLASMKGAGRNHGELERSKRHLESEVVELRRQLENNKPDQGVLDQYRREAEEKAHQEVQQKLEQVNLFLQSQAASQEALDEIKAANEENLRSQLEKKIRELEGELNRARTIQQEMLSQKESTRSELERYRHLYNEEMRLRMSLTAKLERANCRLSEANSKLLTERSRSLMMGNVTSGSLMGPSLDMSALATPANPGTSVGALNRNMSVGYSLPSTESDGQNQRVEDYLAKLLAQKSFSHFSSLQPDS
ncbi:ankyrin repeat domain-containing protein 26 isoform X6 [Poecilia reticulata]|uniref:ankyrin repeat domain-containing protein 26 isoform X6 n=1 Tax=Poecilia reticulata TaxID=8081 RepID=UPI0007E93E1C|nr:PREDICTED: ankyrin repeat domain-containing protein 26-like isoform X6 [Poecilia reticulata]XP_017160785.1 PREDICTED: ankyrin repeat domain-containing protein 26-like isoform X6 [Poecilia reticulata]